MLHSLGKGPRPEQRDLLSRLLDCHVKIRDVLVLARKVATEEASLDEVAESADRVRRYFRRAFPMHTRDEDESIAPRLRAHGIAASLDRMTAEHRDHEDLVDALVSLCSHLRDAPDALPTLRDELVRTLDGLEPALLEHLEEEERDIFPLLTSALDEAARDAIVQEMEARRDADGGGGRGGGGGGRGRR